LAEDQRQHGDIHRVAHVAIQSGNHEMLGGATGAGVPSP
jgi:hypothetical protein